MYYKRRRVATRDYATYWLVPTGDFVASLASAIGEQCGYDI